MSIVNKSFTAVGNSAKLLVPSDSTLKVDITGTFAATIVVEKSRDGGQSWEPLLTQVDDDAEVHEEIVIEDPANQAVQVRARCSAFTSGTVVVALTNENVDGTGLIAAGATTVLEGLTVHTTKLTLTDESITLTDDAGNGQSGGIKLYDMPEGRILILAAAVDASIVLNGTEWTDAAEGDIGLGSAVVSGGGALTGTEQNIIATTAIAAMTAQAGPIDAIGPAAPVLLDGSSTPVDIYMNIRIDDAVAHITGTGTINGDVTLVWINLDE